MEERSAEGEVHHYDHSGENRDADSRRARLPAHTCVEEPIELGLTARGMIDGVGNIAGHLGRYREGWRNRSNSGRLSGDLGWSADLEDGDADENDISRPQRGRPVDFLAVQERPVGRAEILDTETRFVDEETRMTARRGVIVQGEAAGLTSHFQDAVDDPLLSGVRAFHDLHHELRHGREHNRRRE